MRTWLVFTLAFIGACSAAPPNAPPSSPPPASLDNDADLLALASGARKIACPHDQKAILGSDSDQGWGYVEVTRGCTLADGKLEGLTVEELSLTNATQVGIYKHGVAIGVWTIISRDGKILGRYTLDDHGSGEETLRDVAGHTAHGHIVLGERDGTWTMNDTDGKVVVTEQWAHGKLLHQTGNAAWDPSMIDPRDICTATSPKEDGCP